MDENPNSTKRGCGPVGCAIIAVLVVVPILYVLSSGPAYRLVVVHQAMSDETFGTIYAPIFFVVENVGPPTTDWFVRYLYWWIPPNKRVYGYPYPGSIIPEIE